MLLPSTIEHVDNGAFRSCEKLERVEVKGGPFFSGSTFHTCPNLVSIKLSTGTKILPADFASDCEKLTDVSLPNDLETIRSAFKGCSSLAHILLPSSIIEMTNDVFCNCTSLRSVALPDNPKFYIINGGTFGGCTSLSRVYIPKSICYIHAYAFNDCSALRSVCYGGTETEWHKINLSADHNSCLLAASRSYSVSHNAFLAQQ